MVWHDCSHHAPLSSSKDTEGLADLPIELRDDGLELGRSGDVM